MSDSTVRHMVAAIATSVAILAYAAGYISGGFGWWWTFFATFVVYGIVLNLMDAGGHGGH